MGETTYSASRLRARLGPTNREFSISTKILCLLTLRKKNALLWAMSAGMRKATNPNENCNVGCEEKGGGPKLEKTGVSCKIDRPKGVGVVGRCQTPESKRTEREPVLKACALAEIVCTYGLRSDDIVRYAWLADSAVLAYSCLTSAGTLNCFV